MKLNTIFLQVVIVAFGLITFTCLIIFPLREGRAEGLNLFQIYLEPFILYTYISSSIFFIALFNSYKLIGNIKQNQVLTTNSLLYIKRIKKSAYLLSILIIIAGIYVTITHHKDDDPVGFIVLCFIMVIISLSVASITKIIEEIFNEVRMERGEDTHEKI